MSFGGGLTDFGGVGGVHWWCGSASQVSLDHSLVVPFDPEHLSRVSCEEFASSARGCY